ncbi:MAG: TonB-dependent receptor [Gammaproteobacteria bacterium]|nr:MAG: TonB-dependent receptor [Gammaproteobacteria bacterium]
MDLQYKRKTLTLMLATTFVSSAAFAADDSVELTDIEVIGTTPLHGVGLPKDMIPTNVQTATSEDIAKTQSLDLSEFMTRTLGSVNINSAQNNPYQPDVTYRGFSASPLLGLPQGMSVYMDGVRLNAPFGDNVHWDTIPQSAIASINLMPGSNPLFGLNTLGGALSIQSKNGFTHEDDSIQGYAGSFNRHAVEIESGGNDGEFGYFVTGNWFEEDGWRDHSDSEVKQLFANTSWRSETTTLDLSLTATDNDLNGNGPAPVELIDIDREAVFTWPDNTQNEMQLVNLQGSHWINDLMLASGNIYYRHNETKSFNGDGTEYEEGTGADAGFLVDEDGNRVQDENGNDIADQFNGEDLDAINNRGDITEDSGGLGLQLTFLNDLLGYENQLVTGLSYDQGRSAYDSSVEVSSLNADRGTTETGVFVGDEFVDVKADNRTYSLFFTDTMSVTDSLALTLSGRYNNTEIKLKDKLDSASTINETNEFHRFNPAAGLTFIVNEAMSTYLNYSESSRAPTPSELGCSDPNDPCKLPNAFLADPPLEQVVAKSWEGGFRGTVMNNVSWNAGLFSTTNHDDIMFISTSGTTGNTGFFDNIGKTRRQGAELGISGQQNRLSWAVNYSYVEAEFRSPLTMSSPNNPYADGNGDIHVESGDSLPGIPEHSLKLVTDYDFTTKFSAGFDAIANSEQYYRGDESNELDQISGYMVFNLHADYQMTPKINFFAKVDNVFDKEYSNYGLLGEPDEIFPGFSDPRFEGAGAPRAGWVGIKVSM